MNPLTNVLPPDLCTELGAIRASRAKASKAVLADGNARAADSSATIDGLLARLEDWLLDDEQRQTLGRNPQDVFFLYAAALCSRLEAQNPFAPSFAAHDLPTAKLFPPTAAIISRIFRQASEDWTREPPESPEALPFWRGAVVNTPLLAASLALSLALDPTAPATAARVVGDLPAHAQLSRKEFLAAFTVSAIGPHPHLPGTIRLKLDCRHAEVHRSLKRHERVVQQMLQTINRWVSPRFLFSDVLFEITPSGYHPLDLRFTVDAAAALQLFAGNRLYSDNRVFLRELVQNAVDACHLRQIFENHHQPAISIHFNHDISQVTIRDNGIGMDRQWIEKYFLKIGISLYQSGEIPNAPRAAALGFSFISQFGIGFLSSFLVADRIVIKTRKAASRGLMIAISNLRDYFDVREIEEDFPIGTEVLLHLKKSRINHARQLEYVGYLKTHLRFVRLPVTLCHAQGPAIPIGNQPLAYQATRNADAVDFVAPLAFDHAEGALFLRAKRHIDHIYALETAKGGIAVFQDGIFVTQVETLLPEGARGHVVGRINLLAGEKCALSMDRNRIFWSDAQLARIKRVVRRGLVDLANQLMDVAATPEVPDDVQRSLVNHLAIFFEFNTVDDALHAALNAPVRRVVEKRFRDFIRIHFAHTRRPQGIPEADGYGERWQQRILASFTKGGA